MSHSIPDSLWSRITCKTEAFWNSRYYFPVVLATAAVSMFMGNVVPSTVVLAVICGWMLVFCQDILAATLPFLMIFLLSTMKYTALSVFLPCAPLAILPIGGLLVHLLRWRKPAVVGTGAAGLAAVTVATILGGVGTISPGEYFSPLSLYYTLGLGLGLLVTYLLLRAELELPRSYDLLRRLAEMLYTLGLGMILAVGSYYMHHWAEFSKCWELPAIPYRNFAATLLVATLPAVFYMAARNRWHMATVALWCVAMFFTGSRSALLFGAAMVLLGFVYLVKAGAMPLWFVFAVGAAVALAMLLFGSEIYEMFFGNRGDPEYFISPTESRWRLLDQGLADFFLHPLTGIGLGSQSNTELFRGVPGSMVFYHNALIQVMGSMGLVGMVAYGLLLSDRLRLLRKGDEACHVAGMFYIGMLLSSMTNPGLFCPLPNAALTVLVFAVLEKCVDDPVRLLGRYKRK